MPLVQRVAEALKEHDYTATVATFLKTDNNRASNWMPHVAILIQGPDGYEAPLRRLRR